MASQRKEVATQKSKVESIFSMLDDGVAEDLANQGEKTGIKYLQSDMDDWLSRRSDPNTYQGVSTGYDGIDNIIGSFVGGELLLLAGDTGHGKSLLAMNIALNVYQKYQKPVMVVSMELTEDQTQERFYEMSAPDHDYAGIIVTEYPEISYRDIDVIMDKAVEEDACMVVIDHLHFFDEAMGDNQAHALTRVVKHFKAMAVKYELPVMLVSHVTPRKNHDGTSEKPQLHDLRGSRSIEQLSDMVCFVYREDAPGADVEFYLRKNRSREKIFTSTYLKQNGWRLTQDTSWIPEKLV